MIWKVPEVMLQPKNRDLFVLKAKSISSKMAMLSFFVSKFELDVGYLIGGDTLAGRDACPTGCGIRYLLLH
jgi:hypothetical protein